MNGIEPGRTFTITNTVHVEVTQEHIDKAREGRGRGEFLCCSCPIAQALLELLGKEAIVSVGIEGDAAYSAYIPHLADHRILLPPNAAAWAAAFDGNQPVKPFSFELELGKEV